LLGAVLILGVLAQIEYAVGREFPHAGHCFKELLLVLFSPLLGSPERNVGSEDAALLALADFHQKTDVSPRRGVT
jgi:hypothetical protein